MPPFPLTDTTILKGKPADKPVRLFDGGGLYLEISPAGGKLWRLKYRFNGKERLLALGIYPDVSLARAREKRDEARKLLADGDSAPKHPVTAGSAQGLYAITNFVKGSRPRAA